jgi:hypothetical protein
MSLCDLSSQFLYISPFFFLLKVERTRQFLVLKDSLDKQKRVAAQLFKPLRREKPDYATKVCALWQRKDLLTRTSRDVVKADPLAAQGSQFIPEVVDVC